MRYLAALLCLMPALAWADVPGPVNARVVSVYDGDTFTVDAEPWPSVTIRTNVRVAGIDTPEIRGGCAAERRLALKARDRARELLGEQVELLDIRPDKYGGRVGAVVRLSDGRLLADELIAAGLGRPYDGGKRKGWCQ